MGFHPLLLLRIYGGLFMVWIRTSQMFVIVYYELYTPHNNHATRWGNMTYCHFYNRCWEKLQLQSEQSLTWTWLLVWCLWRFFFKESGLEKEDLSCQLWWPSHVSEVMNSKGANTYLISKERMSTRFSQDHDVIPIHWMTDSKRYSIFTLVLSLLE